MRLGDYGELVAENRQAQRRLGCYHQSVAGQILSRWCSCHILDSPGYVDGFTPLISTVQVFLGRSIAWEPRCTPSMGNVSCIRLTSRKHLKLNALLLLLLSGAAVVIVAAAVVVVVVAAAI